LVTRIPDFFHTQIVIKRRKNKVSGLFIDDIWISDYDIIQREVLTFFKKLFQSDDQCHPSSLHLHSIPMIDQQICDLLQDFVFVKKVKDVVFSMNSYKALRPDDFNPFSTNLIGIFWD